MIIGFIAFVGVMLASMYQNDLPKERPDGTSIKHIAVIGHGDFLLDEIAALLQRLSKENYETIVIGSIPIYDKLKDVVIPDKYEFDYKFDYNYKEKVYNPKKQKMKFNNKPMGNKPKFISQTNRGK